jgi:hypothetical protein
VTIARISPGNRPSISAHRVVFRTSTPRRSLRISPASRSTVKCRDSVDFGTGRSATPANSVHASGQSAPTTAEKIATRTGSASACRIASTVTSSIAGWDKGLMPLGYLHLTLSSHGSNSLN